MSEQNNDKWLDEIISKTINTNKPQFEAEKWKQKFPSEVQILQSRASTQSPKIIRWTNIFKSPVTKFASAAVIILCVVLCLNINFHETSNKQPPVISTGTQNLPSPNTDIVTTGVLTSSSATGGGRGRPTTGVGSTVIPFLPPPRTDEVQLDRNLAGEKMNRPITDDGSIQIGKDLLWYSPEIKGGDYLNFRQEDAQIYVSINSGQERLIGVRITTIDDLKYLNYVLLLSQGPLALWCDIQPPVEIAGLPNLEKITSFQQMDPNKLSDMQSLAFLPELERIYVYKKLHACPGVNDISALANLNSLKILVIPEFQNLHEISELGTNLKYLDLTGASNLRNINFLKNNNKLETLKLNSCYYITDISPLANLKELKYLDLFGCKFSNLSPLSNHTNLSYLNLCGCKVTDLRPLASLINLNYLNLGANENLSDISQIAGLSNLKELDLWACHKLSNIRPLSSLHNLETLNLRGCDSISDLSSLSDLQNLTKLDCWGCTKISDLSPVKPLIALDAEIYIPDTLKEQLAAIREQILQERIDESSAIVQVELLEATEIEIGGKIVRSDWKVEVNSYYYGDIPEKIINAIWDNPYPGFAKLELGRYVVLFLKVDESGVYHIIHAQTQLFSNLEDEAIKREYEIIRVRDEISRQSNDSNNLQER
jgi:hypothetical protein